LGRRYENKIRERGREMKCFYHNDLDGRAAGFCVYAWAGLTDLEKYSPEMIQINYGIDFPFEKIGKDELVYIVDYSISPAEMLRLLETTKDIVWIDHHKTAIEKYADFPHYIRGIRKDGEAGCVLTWKYLHWYTARGTGPEDFAITEQDRPGNNVPRCIALVGDRDIWAWKHGDETKNFFAGSQMHNTDPSSDFWWKCMEHEVEPLPLPNTGNATARKRGEIFWARLLQDGETINRYKQSTDEEVNKSLGFDVEFEGLNCWAINRGRVSSDRLGDRIKQYDILMPYSHDGKQFTVSLYSTAVDVSEIAKKYGGGGHKGASGFQCRELPFTKKEAQ
jgi:oligoribonuclease NrnB/cAMP/cGMP phosphodiesterase (DHH superfamily)